MTDIEFLGNWLIKTFHIVKNKKGILFDDKNGLIIQIDFLEIKMREYHSNITIHDKKEVIDYIDDVCGRTQRKSKFYRKSWNKYGIQGT